MFSDVLHRFTKYRVILEFEEILFEIVLHLSSKLGVEIDVGFHLCRVIEFNQLMDSL